MGKPFEMISKQEAVNSQSNEVQKQAKLLEEKLDSLIRAWGGGRIEVALDDGLRCVGTEAIKIVTAKFEEGGWRVRQGTTSRGSQWDMYSVATFILE
jgi:hypothetical protein